MYRARTLIFKSHLKDWKSWDQINDPWPQGYKTFFMLKAELENLKAHKS